ncbi:MAG: branched-chain amino acid aminotransferase [Pseudomonadota bacterium]
MKMAGFDSLEGQIWIDGEFLDWQDAKVHFLTHGLHYGSGVFEGMRAYNGSIFKLTEHNQRLIDSGKIMDMKIPYSVEELNTICYELLERNDLSSAYVRPLAWRGSEMMAISAQSSTIHVGIAAWGNIKYAKGKDEGRGLRLQTSKWRRPSSVSAPVNAKACGLYMICTLSKHEAESAGFDDALMLDYRGQVAEATGANIFFIKDGEIHTPTPDCFLDGITRRTVIGLAEEAGYKVIERAIMPDEVAKFDECFITGTAAEVTAVSAIDNIEFNGGEIIPTLVKAYHELVLKPAPEKLAREAAFA